MSSLTTPTLYLQTPTGTRYAYRLLSPPSPCSSIPLVMHTHFRANMDLWDPLLIDPLALRRPVLLFDQPGTGRSSGVVATTYEAWAEDLLALVRALGFEKIDLLGFSMGGRAVQMVALNAPPGLVRRLVVAGSDASCPPPNAEGKREREGAPKEPIRRLSLETEVEGAIAFSFFTGDERGKRAAGAYFERIRGRCAEDTGEGAMLEFLGEEGTRRQAEASREWAVYNPRNSYERLHEVEIPVLVINGSEDLLIPTSRSWECARRIRDAKLIIYPRSGHGFIWQYAAQVAKDVNDFLDDGGPRANL